MESVKPCTAAWPCPYVLVTFCSSIIRRCPLRHTMSAERRPIALPHCCPDGEAKDFGARPHVSLARFAESGVKPHRARSKALQFCRLRAVRVGAVKRRTDGDSGRIGARWNPAIFLPRSMFGNPFEM